MTKKRLAILLSLAVALTALLPAAFAADERGEGPLINEPPKGITVEELIQRFAAKEKQFKEAREKYTYRQDIKVQTLDGDTVTGEYRMVEDILFDPTGKRIEQVVFAPQSTLQSISMTPEDMDDIEHRLPFVLTSDEIPEYQIMYLGQQREDELHTYVFDIAPKQIEKNKRYFQGKIWVDDHDFQIVKTQGQTVPQIRKKNNENLFPAFTTWRQQIDGQYWFPVYTMADDILHFSFQDVHVREIIKYEDYKRFGANVKITYEGQDIKKGQQGQGQGQTTPPPNTTPPQN